MSASRTQIANMALAHLGVNKDIQDITTDRSSEAGVVRRFWDEVRDATLRSFPWPFAKKSSALQLVQANPTAWWQYAYQYPSDCLAFYRINDGLGTYQDTRQSRVPYEIVAGPSGRLIYTNQQDAVGDYCLRVEETHYWDGDFNLAFSLMLAAYIAPSVTRGDPFKLGQRAMQLAMMQMGIAQKDAANENQDPEEPASEFERVRG